MASSLPQSAARPPLRARPLAEHPSPTSSISTSTPPLLCLCPMELHLHFHSRAPLPPMAIGAPNYSNSPHRNQHHPRDPLPTPSIISIVLFPLPTTPTPAPLLCPRHAPYCSLRQHSPSTNPRVPMTGAPPSPARLRSSPLESPRQQLPQVRPPCTFLVARNQLKPPELHHGSANTSLSSLRSSSLLDPLTSKAEQTDLLPQLPTISQVATNRDSFSSSFQSEPILIDNCCSVFA